MSWFKRKKKNADETLHVLSGVGNAVAKGFEPSPEDQKKSETEPQIPRIAEPVYNPPAVRGFIATWDIKVTDKRYFRQVTIEALARSFWMKTEGHYKETVIRPLLYEDLGLKNWQTPAAIDDSPMKWIDHTLSPYQMATIYKITVASDEPSVSDLIFLNGGNTLNHLNLDELHGVIPLLRNRKLDIEQLEQVYGGIDNIRMEAYLYSPSIFAPGSRIGVNIKNRSAAPGDLICLGGYIIEPDGLTIKT